MNDDATESEERLRRELRAMGALNRELHAQLGGARRLAMSREWLESLEHAGTGTDPRIVRASKGHWVIEGEFRREIRSSLLAAALAEHLGHTKWLTDDEIEAYTEGPPVDVFEGPYGPPFVVVGGRRMPIRGLPMPYPVTGDQMLAFEPHDELNLAAANIPRARVRYYLGRFRSAAARKGGAGPAARSAVDRLVARLRGLVSRGHS